MSSTLTNACTSASSNNGDKIRKQPSHRTKARRATRRKPPVALESLRIPRRPTTPERPASARVQHLYALRVDRECRNRGAGPFHIAPLPIPLKNFKAMHSIFRSSITANIDLAPKSGHLCCGAYTCRRFTWTKTPSTASPRPSSTSCISGDNHPVD